MIRKMVPALVILMAGVAFAGPQIQIPEVEFDFGKIPQQSQVSHRFLLKSTGDDTLKITQVVPGCGCTQAPLEKTILAPGDSTWMEIVFSSKSYRGPIDKRPYIVTNVSADNYYVKFQTDVLSDPSTAFPIRLHPYKLDVSQFGSTPRRSAEFTVENVGDSAFELSVIDTTGRSFDVKMPKTIKPGEKITGTITVHEDMVLKSFDQSFTIVLNDQSKTRYSLPVKRMYREKEPPSFGNSGK